MSNLMEVIKSRRSTRAFKSELPPKDQIMQIVEAAEWAPSGMGKYLWHFTVIYNAEGICRTDRRLLEMARVFRVPLGRRLRGIYLPQVMPYFRTAVSLGLGLCWKAGAAAEIIGLPAGSMGERLYTAKVYFQTADLFAWTVTIVAVSVVFERLFLALVDRLMGKAGL